MLKKFLAIILSLMILLVALPCAVYAEEQPVVYSAAITVTEDGGRYQVGFVNLEFKKGFLSTSELPATFEVKVFAKNGEVGVQVLPHEESFFKKVHIRVDKYSGLLYDEVLGENIQVNVKNQQVLTEHFSWFRFR